MLLLKCCRTQHVTSNNAGICWPTLLRPFARGLKLIFENSALLFTVFNYTAAINLQYMHKCATAMWYLDLPGATSSR